MYEQRIEQGLKSMDQATFQSLMNSFLSYSGYNFISSPGSVVAKNKTSKGAPDSFFYDEDEKKYIFCEFTTLDKNNNVLKFITKLKTDIEHCFNTKKTGIEIDKISEIILAFTSKINPGESEELRNKVHQYNENVNLELYSIQRLAMELVSWPQISNYIPEINFDGIFTIEDFREKSKNGIRPGLENPFVKNNEVYNYFLDTLSENKIVALHGNQGVGKSKLAIEIAQDFSKKHDYCKPIVVKGFRNDLENSLSKLIPPKNNKYIIIFDNYDGTFSNFGSIINSLENITTNIKIIISLQNQFKEQLYNELTNYPLEFIEIEKMKNEDIEKMIKQVLTTKKIRLRNSAMDKTIKISNGNPATALMAILPILDNNDESFLKNPIEIYKNYFENYKKNVSFLNDSKILKTLGILSFFNIIEKKQSTKLFSILETEFNFSFEWELFNELNSQEIVELHGNEVVKISDSILSTYIFYKTFISTSPLISFDKWIEIFIESNCEKINIKIVELSKVIDFNSFQNRIKELLDSVKTSFENDEDKYFKFLEIFYFIYPLETLNLIKKSVDLLPAKQLDVDSFEIPEKNNKSHWNQFRTERYSYEYLLSQLYKFELSIREEALKISFNLILNNFAESKAYNIIKNINDAFSIDMYSEENNFTKQNALLQFLDSNDFTKNEKKLADKIFLYYISQTFDREFTSKKQYSNGSIEFFIFKLFETEGLKTLRKIILNKLIELYGVYPEKIEDIFEKYINQIRDDNLKNVFYIEEDIIHNLFKKWDLKKYRLSKLVYKYCRALKKENIKISFDISSFLDKEKVKKSLIYSSDLKDHLEKKEDLKIKEGIENDLKDNISEEYVKNILNIMNEIVESSSSQISRPSNSYLSMFFEALVEKDVEMFIFAFKYYQQKDFKLVYNGNFLKKIMDKNLIEVRKLYQLINEENYVYKDTLNLEFFTNLKKSNVDKNIFFEFIEFIKSSNILGMYVNRSYNYSFKLFSDCFLKYKDDLDNSDGTNNIFQYIIKILINRDKTENLNLYWYGFISDNYTYFEDNIAILKDVFSLAVENDVANSFNVEDLEILYNLDPKFPLEFIEKYHNSLRIPDKGILSFVFNDESYSPEKIDEIVELILKNPNKLLLNKLLVMLFSGDEKKNNEHLYIERLIKNNHGSEMHISAVFNMLLHNFDNKHFITFLEKFLLLNSNIGAMKNIPFSKGFETWVGSQIPTHRSKIDFYNGIIKMIENLPNPSNFVNHKKFLEELIEKENNRIKSLEKLEFEHLELK
ncbi:hypothetical protein [Methanobrevibacter curvatus]|uniref:Uncharacterized protein n=1 Tax=Methanobrevibacter curvatus TaxID=49547 RepID=A0A166C8B3_9EURY|nr:hypothetical protein [Methanobrevibacter curvatus]KZX12147.1 hypothetical protein MBCUR_11560 [Methanobrevibacter curvatus]